MSRSRADRSRSAQGVVWRSKKAIGVTIRAIRSGRGMSQRELAEYLGAPGSQSQVSLWENGRHRPSPQTLRRIAELVDQTLEIFQHPQPWSAGMGAAGSRESRRDRFGRGEEGPDTLPRDLPVTAPETELLAFLAQEIGWENLARELVHQDLMTTAYALALREGWGRFRLRRLDRIRDRILDHGSGE